MDSQKTLNFLVHTYYTFKFFLLPGIMEIIAAIMEAIATIIIFIAGDVILASVFTPFPVLVGVSGILGVIYSCKTHLNQLNIAHMVFAILSTIASGFYFLYVVVFAISSEG